MRLTNFTDYGLRILTYLALKPEGELANITEVTDIYNLSRNHVVKIVHALGKANILHTVRGKGGGIRLQRPPADINIGDVVRHLEPSLDIIDCNSPPCRLRKACQLRPILDEASDAFVGVLDKYTLADLVASPQPLNKVLFFSQK